VKTSALKMLNFAYLMTKSVSLYHKYSTLAIIIKALFNKFLISSSVIYCNSELLIQYLFFISWWAWPI